MSLRFNHCRICGKSEIGDATHDKLVQYGVRHYAHFACYLDAGKKLSDLPAWKVGEFPFRLLQTRGLLDEALTITAQHKETQS